MVIKRKELSELVLDHDNIVGKDWAKVLKPLLDSTYMKNLLYFLNESYQVKTIRPKQSKIFSPFINCPVELTKVVIIGKEPYNNDENTGVPFANHDKYGKLFTLELLKIMNTIIKTVYDNCKIHIDSTLEYWSYQGVLLLNSALTIEEGIEESHLEYWRDFTRQTVKLISKNKPGTIFCLWGEEAQYFKQYIDTKTCFVLECEHPSTAVAEKREWRCDHFNEINELISKHLGENECIEW